MANLMFDVSIVTFELLLGLRLRHPKVRASSSHPRGVVVAIPVPSAHETPFTSNPAASRGAEIRMVLTQRRDFEWKDTGEELGEGTTHFTIRGASCKLPVPTSSVVSLAIPEYTV